MTLSYFYIFIFTICTIVIVKTLKRNQPFYELHRRAAIYVCISLSVEYLTTYMGSQGIWNNWVYNIYMLFYFGFLAYIFLFEIRNTTIRLLIKVFVGMMPLMILGNSFYQDFQMELHTNILLIGSLFMVFLSIVFLYELLSRDEFLESDILQLPFFWICIGILFHFSATFSWFSYRNFMVESDYELAAVLANIPTITASLMYVLFAVGFSCHKLFQT